MLVGFPLALSGVFMNMWWESAIRAATSLYAGIGLGLVFAQVGGMVSVLNFSLHWAGSSRFASFELRGHWRLFPATCATTSRCSCRLSIRNTTCWWCEGILITWVYEADPLCCYRKGSPSRLTGHERIAGRRKGSRAPGKILVKLIWSRKAILATYRACRWK